MEDDSKTLNFDQVQKREKSLQLNKDLQEDMAKIGSEATESLKKIKVKDRGYTGRG